MHAAQSEVAAIIDHTLLRPEAGARDVLALCDEAEELQVHAVCISPTMVELAARRLSDSSVKVVAVTGFPSGAHRSEVKSYEAARAAAEGAVEVDLVMSLGLALEGAWDGVRADIAAVREVLPNGQLLKVILEAALLTPEQIMLACYHAEAAGADLVKTSTGFHHAGGTSLRAVRIMASAVAGRLGVSASGGIHDAQTALEMIDAGATRLGMSATVSVLAELTRDQPAGWM